MEVNLTPATAAATASPEFLVCEALAAATNDNHEVVRIAEQKLAEWELQPGFFSTLARICMSCGSRQQQQQQQQQQQHQQTSQKSTPDVNARWMAAVYLKNGVNKYWRRSTRLELPATEKQQIREQLLAHYLVEPVPQVSCQIAVLIARIARIDCPREWPQLVPHLMQQLQTTSDGAGDGRSGDQQRVLFVLHHVVKALASRRMMAEKRVFEEFTTNIFPFMQDLWNSATELFFHQLKSAPANALATLDRALITLRVLRKLAVFGYAKPHKSECCMRFLEQLFARLKQCLECRFELQRLGAEEALVTLLEKFILKQIKTLTEFQGAHSGSFARYVPAALEFSFNHVFHEGTRLIFTDNVINFRHFAIHCINLMKGIMMSGVHKTRDPNSDPDTVLPCSLAVFFSHERLCYICEKIVTHYFLLTQLELQMWMDDPEGFAQDDYGESWRFALRPCVETFFLTCFSECESEMTAEVVKYIRKAQQMEVTPSSDLEDILLKDAIYNAAGLASFHFFNDIDFNEWFSGQLLAELRIDTDNFRILRRRIIWLLGEWVGVKFSQELRPLGYAACLHLLRSVEDMSIRLAAAHTLSALISDFDFTPLPFLPYLEPAFDALFVLLRESKECDTKMNVLNIMSLIVEKMSDNIESQVENLIAYLPLLWKESDDYEMLRCAIISTLHQIVKAFTDIPEHLLSFLYSVIELSTNLQEPSHIYLIEEGLSLWVAVIENSTSVTPQLIDLCRQLLPIVQMSTENLRTVLVLVQAYVLLDAHAFLDRFGRQFVEYCVRSFDDIRTEGIHLMLKVFETILKTDANNGLELVRPALPYIFKQVYANKAYPMLMGMHLMMVARVLLISQDVFTAVLHELQLPNTLETILDVWIRTMPLISEVEKRKLFCLAFVSIFSNNAVLLERFSSIMQSIATTLVEVMQEDIYEDDLRSLELSTTAAAGKEPDNDSGDRTGGADKKALVKYVDSLVFLDEMDMVASQYDTLMDDSAYKTYHYDRCRQLALKDPVHRIALSEYIEFQLNALRQQMGEQPYQQLMQSVYGGTLLKIGTYVQLNLSFQPN